MDREEKQEEINFLTDAFSKSQLAVCFDYHRLTVAEVTKLRKELREAGAVSRVVKNTLARISAKSAFKKAQEAELKKFVEILEGPCFVVVAENDPIAPAKVIAKFNKEKPDKKLNVKGGIFEGAFLDSKGVEALSSMPGRRELLAKLLGLLAAPATQLVRLLQEPGARVARVLDARAKQEKSA